MTAPAPPIDIPPVYPYDDVNRGWVEHVHPSGWVNPTPVGRYNMVVLGAGTAGLVTAAACAGLGGRVAIIEKHLMGGDCLNVGCVPSKALLRCARAAAEARRARDFGVRGVGDVDVDFAQVMGHVRAGRAHIAPNDSAERFRGLGVDVYLGKGRFTGPDTAEVGGQTLQFARACIATGARAAIPPIPGLAEAGCLTNETVFSLTELPKRLAVIGAGPIGVEMSQAFARFGSKVALLEAQDRILSREGADAAAIVAEALQRDGVDIRYRCKITAVTRDGDERILTFEGDDCPPLHVDEILVGVGRVPNVEGLNLDAAGVKYDRSGVTVDDHLRTTNPRIYAAGDICSKYKFTHAADFLARILIRNALFFGRARASSLIIPWCTYTEPELAHVGMSEQEAKQSGQLQETYTVPFDDVDRAIVEGETHGFVRIGVGRKGRILSATIVAPHAGDMIGEVTLAMRAGLSISTVGDTIHPYPTLAEAIRKVGDLHARAKLTPTVSNLFRTLLRWRR